MQPCFLRESEGKVSSLHATSLGIYVVMALPCIVNLQVVLKLGIETTLLLSLTLFVESPHFPLLRPFLCRKTIEVPNTLMTHGVKTLLDL